MSQKKRSNVLQYRRDAEIYFEISIKYARKRQFNKAMVFLSRAVEEDPFNPDYLFNLACIYTELGDLKKSSEILFQIIETIDPTFSDCYFGIACNYFDSGNMSRARGYFEKYLEVNPYGQFAYEVHEILDYLSIYGERPSDIKKDRIVNRLCTLGMQYLVNSDYRRALHKLKKAIEIDPVSVRARNTLSLVCFFTGEIDKAISLARSVIKLQPGNDCAHCYQVLFYAQKGMPELYAKYLKTLSRIKIKNKNKEELTRSLHAVLESKLVSQPVKDATREIMLLKSL